MARYNSIFSGSIDQNVDQDHLKNAIHKVIKQAAAHDGAPALAMFAQLQKERENRLNAAAKGLTKPLGKDHPDVIAIQDEAKSVAGLYNMLDTQNKRLKSWPKIRANEWAVFGTVTDTQGQPAIGLTVRVYDHDRKYDDLLGETETDADGSFSVVYHERDFAEAGENLPELYLMIADSKGNLLYSSKDDIRFDAGQSEYFSIQIGQENATTPRKPSEAAKKSVRKTSKN